MTIADPNHRFRLMFKVHLDPYEGERSFYSSTQDNLHGVLRLVQAVARSPLHPHVRSYVIHEETYPKSPHPSWHELEYSDWCDLAWPPKTKEEGHPLASAPAERTEGG